MLLCKVGDADQCGLNVQGQSELISNGSVLAPHLWSVSVQSLVSVDQAPELFSPNGLTLLSCFACSLLLEKNSYEANIRGWARALPVERPRWNIKLHPNTNHLIYTLSIGLSSGHVITFIL